MKVGYYVEIAGYYLIVNQVLPNGKFDVDTGFITDGRLEGDECGEYTAQEITQWEKETRAEMEEYQRQSDNFQVDQFGRPLITKQCVGCDCTITVIADYDVCDNCADKREIGIPLPSEV